MLYKIKECWNEILQNLKEEYDVSDVSYKTWLLPLEVIDADESEKIVTLLIPEEHLSLNYIKKKYAFLLQISIEEVTGYSCTLEFVNPGSLKEKKANISATDAKVLASNSNINYNYTFDSFVVGSNNRMAHAASLAVAESPAEIYNPLFIYGGVGLGKTHLMHAIGNFILKTDPSKKVLYVSSEVFTNELIEAIRNKNNYSTVEFREKYRNNDVLLIDDIQFIIDKESTQEEFFHTFNALHEAKKQIIISSDRPPKELITLEERLVSRFEWGLTVDISAPDYETRMAILRKKEEMDGLNIDNEVIKYTASNIKSNIRELEGALTKIVALSKLDNREITLELAQEALKDIISPEKAHEVTAELIINVVSEHYSCSAADIISVKRNKEIVLPRQIVMYLCRTMTDLPLQHIGKVLGNRDHTTVIHGADKIAAELDTNEALKNTIDVLKKKILPS